MHSRWHLYCKLCNRDSPQCSDTPASKLRFQAKYLPKPANHSTKSNMLLPSKSTNKGKPLQKMVGPETIKNRLSVCLSAICDPKLFQRTLLNENFFSWIYIWSSDTGWHRCTKFPRPCHTLPSNSPNTTAKFDYTCHQLQAHQINGGSHVCQDFGFGLKSKLAFWDSLDCFGTVAEPFALESELLSPSFRCWNNFWSVIQMEMTILSGTKDPDGYWLVTQLHWD